MKGLAHITGSGIPGNVPRCLPDGTRAVLEERRVEAAAGLRLHRSGWAACRRDEMYSTFNMGLGMIVVVPPADGEARRSRSCAARGVPAWEVGRVEAGQGEPTAVIVR